MGRRARRLPPRRRRRGRPLAARGGLSRRGRGGVRIGELATRLGVSHKTLIARCQRACGTTPTLFGQLLRFHRFVSSLPVRDDLPTWADLVADSPYYDQPHVIRAFRRFSGYTPAEYHARVAEFGPDAASFVPLDEVPGRPVTG